MTISKFVEAEADSYKGNAYSWSAPANTSRAGLAVDVDSVNPGSRGPPTRPEEDMTQPTSVPAGGYTR